MTGAVTVNGLRPNDPAPVNLTLSFDYKVETTGNTTKEAQLFFEFEDGTNTYLASPYPFESGDSGGYVFGSSVTISIGGTGPVTITDLKFRLFAKSGKPKKIWLDNLVLQGPGGGGTVALQQWREIVSN